jgi:hypothetical protein
VLAAAVVVVGSGVLATVESPEPHPASVTAAETAAATIARCLIRSQGHTTRTVPPSEFQGLQARPTLPAPAGRFRLQLR